MSEATRPSPSPTCDGARQGEEPGLYASVVKAGFPNAGEGHAAEHAGGDWTPSSAIMMRFEVERRWRARAGGSTGGRALPDGRCWGARPSRLDGLAMGSVGWWLATDTGRYRMLQDATGCPLIGTRGLQRGLGRAGGQLQNGLRVGSENLTWWW